MSALAREEVVPTGDEPVIVAVLDEQRRVLYLKIVHRRPGEAATRVEVLGPASQEGKGREQYLRKQADLLVDYSQPPHAPLPDAERTWLEELLREQCRMPTSDGGCRQRAILRPE